MNLNLTWDGPTGPQINYLVEYKPVGAINYITAVTGLHNNFYTIEDLEDGFYDVKVSHVCSEQIIPIVFPNAGKPACADPKFSTYSILSENETSQTIRVTIANYKPNIKVKVTRINDNVLISESVISTLGTFDVTLEKGSIETYTYKIEFSNVCTIGQSSFVDAGIYSAGYVARGLELIYENFNEPYNITYKNLDTNETYNDPETIPPQKYYVVIDMPGCGTIGKMLVRIISDGVQLRSTEIASPVRGDGSFRFPFNDLNLLNGPTGGTYITTVKFEFTCD